MQLYNNEFIKSKKKNNNNEFIYFLAKQWKYKNALIVMIKYQNYPLFTSQIHILIDFSLW